MLKRSRDARTRVAEWIELRAQNPGLKQYEIAEKMGITYVTLRNLLSSAARNGWLVFDDPMEKIEHQIIPKATENLLEFLNEKDKTVTLETMKATAFKQYAATMGINDAPQNVLALRIEMTGTPGETKVVEGQIVGRPKELEE
jgi:transposase